MSCHEFFSQREFLNPAKLLPFCSFTKNDAQCDFPPVMTRFFGAREFSLRVLELLAVEINSLRVNCVRACAFFLKSHPTMHRCVWNTFSHDFFLVSVIFSTVNYSHVYLVVLRFVCVLTKTNCFSKNNFKSVTYTIHWILNNSHQKTSDFDWL